MKIKFGKVKPKHAFNTINIYAPSLGRATKTPKQDIEIVRRPRQNLQSYGQNTGIHHNNLRRLSKESTLKIA